MMDLKKYDEILGQPIEMGSVIAVGRDDMIDIITRLRQTEKDAARYRWIKESSQLGVGRCGVDWELHFDGPAPDNSEMLDAAIDEAMQCQQ